MLFQFSPGQVYGAGKCPGGRGSVNLFFCLKINKPAPVFWALPRGDLGLFFSLLKMSIFDHQEQHKRCVVLIQSIASRSGLEFDLKKLNRNIVLRCVQGQGAGARFDIEVYICCYKNSVVDFLLWWCSWNFLTETRQSTYYHYKRQLYDCLISIIRIPTRR